MLGLLRHAAVQRLNMKMERCCGCAFTKGAVANGEINNKLGAALAALAAVPFLCHDKLGWKKGVPSYPASDYDFRLAYENLRAAPDLVHIQGMEQADLQQDRDIIGRQPMCQGWRESVAAIAKTRWFNDPANKRAAHECLTRLELYLKPGQEEKQKSKRLADVRAAVVALGKHMKACGGEILDVFRELTV